MHRACTKSLVLAALNRNKGSFFSGQELADSLGVTRAAVWKAIQSLRLEGYAIEGFTKRGYSLDLNADVLDSDSIRSELTDEENAFYREIICVGETTSTNTLVKERYAASAPEGLVVSAETQTGGRGRFGRSFYSPAGSGVYFSVLLKPKKTAQSVALVTAVAAVAAARACEKINGDLPKGAIAVKWVNDLFLNGRKICGILTEGALSVESGEMDFAVLGVGINLTFQTSDAPEDLKNVGGLFQDNAPVGARAKLIAAFLGEFHAIYVPLFKTGNDKGREARDDLLDAYRRRFPLVGQKVDVVDNLFDEKKARVATVVGVDEQFRLMVAFDDKPDRIERLKGGEIRVRSRSPQVQ